MRNRLNRIYLITDYNKSRQYGILVKVEQKGNKWDLVIVAIRFRDIQSVEGGEDWNGCYERE